MQAIRLYTILLASFIFSATAAAQVFDLGPSDSALFTSVINLPGDVSPSSVGGIATQQLNVANGGVLSPNFDIVEVFQGSEININGGVVSSAIEAGQGSEVNVSGGLVTNNLLANNGSVINIFSGGTVNSQLLAAEGEVNINGGLLEGFISDTGGVVNISGGTVENGFTVQRGSVVNMSGGTVGTSTYCPCEIFVNGDSVLNLSGGSIVGAHLTAEFGGSVVNMSGGTVDDFLALQGSEVNISGGSAGVDRFTAGANSIVNLFGSDFVLDGILLDELIAGEAFTITDRDVTLSGLLNDGTEFSYDLNSNSFGFQHSFNSAATLTVTLTSIPEPTSAAILILGCGLVGMRRKKLH